MRIWRNKNTKLLNKPGVTRIHSEDPTPEGVGVGSRFGFQGNHWKQPRQRTVLHVLDDAVNGELRSNIRVPKGEMNALADCGLTLKPHMHRSLVWKHQNAAEALKPFEWVK